MPHVVSLMEEFVKERKQSLFALGVIIAGLFLFLPGLGSDSIVTQGDITMHVGLIRDSLREGTILVPHLYGLPNGFKPPFLFWTGMVSDALFGVSPWAERLPSALFLMATALVIYITLIRAGQSGYRSFLGAVAFLLTVGIYKFSRLVLMEPSLTFFIALGSALLLQHSYFRSAGNENTRTSDTLFIILAGMVFGISGLIKGPLSIVYGGIIFVIYAIYRLLDWDPDSRKWKILQTIPGIAVEGILFGTISLIPLALWSTSVYFFAVGGPKVLQFFYGIENAGKFGAENQSSLRIVQGLIFYTFPWSLLLIYAIVESIKNPIRPAGKRAVRVMLYAVAFFLLLHMLPDRKADYYVIPFLPLIFIASGIGSEKSTDSRMLHLATGFTGIFIALLWGGTEALLLYTGLKSVDASTLIFAFMAGFLMLYSLFLIARKTISGTIMKRSGLVMMASMAIFYLAFQYRVLPLLSYPPVPESARNIIQNGLCILNGDSATVTEVAMHLPGRDVVPVQADNLSLCREKSYPLLVTGSEDPRLKLCPQCNMAMEWSVWKDNMEISHLLNKKFDRDQEILLKKYMLFNVARN